MPVVVWAANGHLILISHYLVHCPALMALVEVIRGVFVRVLVFFMVVEEAF